MPLQDVNFTNGIRSEIINQNFQYLNGQIKDDRRLMSGHGVAHGFNISVDGDTFTINVTSGNLVSLTGELIAINGVSIPINLNHILQTITEDLQVVDNIIELSDVPYASDGKCIAYNAANPNHHVSLRYVNLTPVPSYEFVTPSSIHINGSAGTIINTTYHVARAICYAIYVDTDNNIQCYPSVMSSSPSIYQLSNFQYYLGVVKIIPYENGNTKLHVQINNVDRTKVYVNEANELYLDGKRFNDLTSIHLVEPDNPKENDIWYDTSYGSNVLKVWREIGGYYAWINLNDYTYINSIDIKLWHPEHESYTSSSVDGKYFVFNRDETEMFYYGDKNELSVTIDNGLINHDQFLPITAQNALYILEAEINELSQEDIIFRDILLNTGYTAENVTPLIYNVDGDNNIISSKGDGPICIGFELEERIAVDLSNPYNKKGPYVEATVQHSFTTSSVQSKLQRNALFVDENSIIYTQGGDLFATDKYYLLGENQLEVFINGIKLDKSTAVHPNGSFDEVPVDESKKTNLFRINRTIVEGSVITYRISRIYTSTTMISSTI